MSISSAFRKAHRGALGYAVASILACSLSAHADAQALSLSRTVTVKISPQKVSTALLELSQQAGVQVLMPGEIGDQQSTQGVNGEMSLEQALQKLLEGTSLRFKAAGENVIGVESATAKKRAGMTSTSLMRLAAAEGEQESSAPSDGRAVSENARAQAARTALEDRAPQGGGLEEIIVTAQKREERAFDVPISMVALGADELQKRRIANLDDLAMAVPGLSIQSAGGFQRRIMLRGISNIFGSSSLIGLYLDEASVTSGADLQLDLRTYDLERIEVLRGPQGTLYGEGSVGGTIRFLTRNPDLESFAMKADVTASFTDDGDPGQRFETAVNIPLVEDELALRVVGTYDHLGGWIDQPAVGRENFNDQDGSDIRVKGLWRPTANFAVNATAVVHRIDNSVNTGEDEAGNYTQPFFQLTTPQMSDDYDIYNLTLTYDFPSVRLLSTTSSIEQDRVQSNFGFHLPIPNPATSPPLDVLKPLHTRASELFSEEIRLSSIGDGRAQWTLGAFYRDSLIKERNTFYIAARSPVPTPLPTLAVSPRETDSRSGAVFGDANYQLTDRLTLGAGVRYFEEDQEFTDASGVTQKGTFHTTNPRVYTQVRLSEHVNAYASAAKGFRSGGFNALNRPSYEPENVWTYELGTKVAPLGGNFSADAAVYYSDYRDYQVVATVVVPTGAFNITSNAGNARIQGAELGFTWRLMQDWTFGFSGTYVDSEFRKISAPASSHAVGDPIDLFPEYGYAVSLQRDLTWGEKSAAVRVDYTEQGRSTYRNRFNGPWFFSESDVINMLNLNASVEWSFNFTIGLFAQNLLNDRGFVDPFEIQGDSARSRPRTYGIHFGFTFD